MNHLLKAAVALVCVVGINAFAQTNPIGPQVAASSPSDRVIATTNDTANPGGPTGAIQVNAGSGLFGAATAPQIGAGVTDSNGNTLVSASAPTAGFPLPAGFVRNILIGPSAGLNLGNGTGLVPTGDAIFIGANAGKAAATNNGSVFIGSGAGAAYQGNNLGGEDGNSVCIGPFSCGTDLGNAAAGMFEVVAMGNKAYELGTGEISSVIIGAHTLAPSHGKSNVYIGGNSTEQVGLDGDFIDSTNGLFVGASIFTSVGMTGFPTATTYSTTNETVLGSNAATCWFNTSFNTLIGAGAGGSGGGCTDPTKLVTGTNNIVITAGTTSSGPGSSVTSGADNIIMGGAGSNGVLTNPTGLHLTTGTSDILIGASAGSQLATANSTTLVGYGAGNATTVQLDAFGAAAGLNITTGTADALFGKNAGLNITTGTLNSCFGNASCNGTTTSSDATMMGANSGLVDNGQNLSYFGFNAGRRQATTVTSNTAMGWDAFQAAIAGVGGGEQNDSFFGATANCYSCTNSEGFGFGAVTGDSTHLTVTGAAQIGTGVNNSSNTIQFQSFNFLDNGGNAKFKTVSYAVGTAVASATTIAPTSGITHITGASPIATITVPTVLSGGGTFTGCLKFIPDGAYSFTAAGNIATVSTASVGRLMEVCYDGTMWYPSY